MTKRKWLTIAEVYSPHLAFGGWQCRARQSGNDVYLQKRNGAINVDKWQTKLKISLEDWQRYEKIKENEVDLYDLIDYPGELRDRGFVLSKKNPPARR